jgi:LysM repeat protein
VRVGVISLAAGALVLLGACGSDAASPFASEQDDELVDDTSEIPVEPFPETLPDALILREEDASDSGDGAETTEVMYTIQPGDTLVTVANQFGTTVEAIQRLNGLADPSILQIGDELRIPVASERIAATTDDDVPILKEEAPPPGEPYAIQPGDSLIEIGLAFGVDYLEIAAHNNLTDFEIANLQVGQVIFIPLSPDADPETDTGGDPPEDEEPAEPPG